MSAKQWCIHCSKTCQTLKHFDNVFATGGNNMASNYDVHSPPVLPLLEGED